MIEVSILFMMIAILEFFFAKKNKPYYIDIMISLTTLIITLVFSNCININKIFAMIPTDRQEYSYFFNSTWLPMAISIVFMDFLYYWMHRCEHYFSFLWSSHYVHHSSPYFNSFVSLRPSLFQFLYLPVFMMPLVILPFSLDIIINSIVIGKLYSLFTHYEYSPVKIERYIGKLLVTPKFHKIHHACNKEYIDKNFGGIFIIWDKVFGTYVKNAKEIKLGVSGAKGDGFFIGVLGGFRHLKVNFIKQKGIKMKLKSLIFMKI